MSLRLLACSGATSIALVCALGGCGGSGMGTTSVHRAAPHHPSAESSSIGGPPPGRPVRGFCGRATVSAGKDPRVLKVTAWCVPTERRPGVGFALTRYAPGSPGRPVPELGHVERVVAVRPKANALRPHCLPVHNGVFCGVDAHRPIQLQTILEVQPETRCRFTVSVLTEFANTCRPKNCIEGNLTVYSLFSGLPKGC